MKTIAILITLAFLAFRFEMKAQVNDFRSDCIPANLKPKKTEYALMPVFYNYSKRQLFYNGTMRMKGNDFLGMCRGINDVQVKRQIARYDQLTRNKKTLVALSIVTGVAGYITTLVSVSYLNSTYAYGRPYTALGIGLGCLLACPILAISTSIPHQKRKEVVFRDLPSAYNFYVEKVTNP